MASLDLRSDFNTYFYLGVLYRKLGKLKELMIQYNNSLEINPQSSIPKHQLIRVLQKSIK